MKCHGFVVLSWATLACFSVPLVSSIHPAHAAATTIGVCEAKSSVVRVHKRNSELKLRVFRSHQECHLARYPCHN